MSKHVSTFSVTSAYVEITTCYVLLCHFICLAIILCGSLGRGETEASVETLSRAKRGSQFTFEVSSTTLMIGKEQPCPRAVRAASGMRRKINPLNDRVAGIISPAEFSGRRCRVANPGNDVRAFQRAAMFIRIFRSAVFHSG